MKTFRPSKRFGSLTTATFLCALVLAFEAAAQPKPALVRNTDEPGRNPYLAVVLVDVDTCTPIPSNCNVDLATVPAGKRLVLTFASAAFLLDTSSPSRGGAVSITTSLLVAGAGVYLPAAQPAIPGGTLHFATGPITFYVEPGETPRVNILTSLHPAGSKIELTLAGYYVILP